MAWSKPDGTLGANAPPVAEIASRGWVAPESLTAIGGLVGAPAALDKGIFGSDHGTKLNIVSFEHDTLCRPAENEATYQYVTGESPERGWARIDGANAVHGLPISDPAAMLAALEGRMTLA